MAKSSSNSDKHPYLKVSFWENAYNQFWESDLYSEKTKEEYRQWLRDQRSDERALTRLR